jgi:hypothetical protein
MRIDMRVTNNKMREIAKRAAQHSSSGGVQGALAAGAAQLQREIMMQAMSMGIWDTGNLINSHTRHKISDAAWRIVSPAEYSVYVHMGTSSMAARPWMEIAVKKSMPPIIDMIERAVMAP